MIDVLKRPRALLTLMLLAVLMAGLAQWALSARRVDAAPAAVPATPVAASLMAVAGPLPPGHLIQPGDLAKLAWPAENLPAGAILAGSAEARALVGSVTRRAFADGELVLPSAVLRPGDRGFLASVISPGHRAIAIAVEAATAAGGLIWPGDRVDVILTQELRDDSVPLGQRVLSETILSDARILSTDQTLATAAQAPSATETTPGRPAVPATVTLEVTPAEAERVTVGGTLGKLHLTLRAVAAETGTAPQAATWASNVSPGLAAVRLQPVAARSAASVAPAPSAQPRPAADAVRIYRGSAEGVK
jgi:pilus assembly protein CpaB